MSNRHAFRTVFRIWRLLEDSEIVGFFLDLTISYPNPHTLPVGDDELPEILLTWINMWTVPDHYYITKITKPMSKFGFHGGFKNLILHCFRSGLNLRLCRESISFACLKRKILKLRTLFYTKITAILFKP